MHPVLKTQFKSARRARLTIWVARSITDPMFVDALVNADGLLKDPKCQLIKDQRKITVGRIKVSVGGEIRSLYLKRYNAFSLRYKLMSLFSRSGAVRALRGAVLLAEAGIPSVLPLAGVEERFFGILQRSFFVTEEITGAKTSDAYWTEDLRDRADGEGFKIRRSFLAELAALFHNLHARRTYHSDLKDANIMALPGENQGPVRFFLLDLEGVRRYRYLSRRRKIKNLMQLYRTLGRHLTRSQQLFFLNRYMENPSPSRKAVQDLIRCVINRARRLDASKGIA